MSMFISKALRRAEVFLEQVDESVAQASRRLVVEGATGAVDDQEELTSDEEDSSQNTRASAIPRAELRAKVPAVEPTTVDLDAQVPDAWGGDVVIDDGMFQSPGSHAEAEDTFDMESDGMEVPDVDAEQHAHVELVERGNVNAVESSFASPLPPADAVSLGDDTPVKSAASITPQKVAPQTKKVPTPQRPPRPSQSLPSVPVVLPTENDEYVSALKAETTELRKELELVEADFEKSRREKSKLVKNLKRMKDIISEMDETLREKSAEARSLEAELVSAKDQIASLQAKSLESESRGKDGMDNLRKELTVQITSLQQGLDSATAENGALKEENERLKEALLQGHEVEVATADGARQEASQAHRAYEAEAQAHRETRKTAKEREEALEAEAALATNALAAAQRKAEECIQAASTAKSAQRAAETKLTTVTSARDAAFARIEDLQEALRLYERGEGDEAPGQKEAKAMTQTVAELENALEAKNVELNRLEGELESLRASFKSPRHTMSPRSPGQTGRSENGNHVEVEVKLRHMADAALRKQAQLEVLRSENRALQHQLTTERKRTREAQAMAAAASSSRQTIRGGFRGILDTGEEDRGERVYGVRDGPLARFRTPRNWPRSVSKVVTGMDRFSAQALGFLRKEPLLRIVLLLYLAAMHIFVYSLLHWHVETVSGSVDAPHGRIASAKSGGQMRGAP